MEGIAFSDGSRTVYLAAGYYVVSRGARVIRVISPKPKEHEDANTPLSRFQDYEQQVSLYEGDGIEYQDQQVTGLIGGTSATPGRDSYSESSHEETVEGRGHASATLQDTVHQVSLSPVGGYLTPAPGSYDEDTSMMNDGAIQGYTTVIEIGSPLYTESRTGTDRQGSYMSQGLLSFDRFAQMGATSYDPQWIYNNGVDPNVLNGFTSRIKIEEMFGKGVFEIGDIFRLVDQSGRIFLDREAVVTSFPDARLSPPDFRVHTFLTRRDRFLHACNGLGDLYAAMAGNSGRRRVGYKKFQVFRNGVDIGNLAELRQALHVWEAEKDEWARLRV